MELGPRSGKLGRIRLGGGVTVSGGSTNGAAALDEQYRLVLTAHPLQRVGAYALVALATALNDYEDLADAGDTYAVGDARIRPPSFVAAVDRMTEDAVSAALVRDTRSPNGYWLKCSMSFFPNAKMNHNSISKKVDEVIEEEVRAWRRMPPVSAWPGVTCVLCGRTAVGYYGKWTCHWRRATRTGTTPRADMRAWRCAGPACAAFTRCPTAHVSPVARRTLSTAGTSVFWHVPSRPRSTTTEGCSRSVKPMTATPMRRKSSLSGRCATMGNGCVPMWSSLSSATTTAARSSSSTPWIRRWLSGCGGRCARGRASRGSVRWFGHTGRRTTPGPWSWPGPRSGTRA